MRAGKVLPKNGFGKQAVKSCDFGSFQAEELRQSLREKKGFTTARAGKKSIAIISGKGGVGKSNIALNLALALGGRWNVPTAIIDADLGLANTDVLVGLEARLTLENVFSGELSVRDILVPVSENVWLVPGGSGIPELADMTPERRRQLLPEMLSLDDLVDIIVIDGGAGIHSSVRDFALAADAVVVVTTPEPTAVRDAYSMIKSLSGTSQATSGIGQKELFLLVNMAYSDREAAMAAKRLIDASGRFLGIELEVLAFLPHDARVPKSVKARRPVLAGYPGCAFSRTLSGMAGRLLPAAGKTGKEDADGHKEGPMKRFVSAFLRNRALS
jgi:flagellar biosynthesis protein FlhG